MPLLSTPATPASTAHVPHRQPLSGHERHHPYVHPRQRRRIRRAEREGDVSEDIHFHRSTVQAHQATKVSIVL